MEDPFTAFKTLPNPLPVLYPSCIVFPIKFCSGTFFVLKLVLKLPDISQPCWNCMVIEVVLQDTCLDRLAMGKALYLYNQSELTFGIGTRRMVIQSWWYQGYWILCLFHCRLSVEIALIVKPRCDISNTNLPASVLSVLIFLKKVGVFSAVTFHVFRNPSGSKIHETQRGILTMPDECWYELAADCK